MAKDVTTFLSWAAEPEHDERKKYGIKAVIIFSTLFALSVYIKRFKWGPIKNRRICTFSSSISALTSTDWTRRSVQPSRYDRQKSLEFGMHMV